MSGPAYLIIGEETPPDLETFVDTIVPTDKRCAHVNIKEPQTTKRNTVTAVGGDLLETATLPKSVEGTPLPSDKDKHNAHTVTAKRDERVAKSFGGEYILTDKNDPSPCENGETRYPDPVHTMTYGILGEDGCS